MIKIKKGVYKGYRGKVVDATETTVRVELQAQQRTVTVNRDPEWDQRGPPPGGAPVGPGGGAPGAPPPFGAPPRPVSGMPTPSGGAKTPTAYPATPAHQPGGMTPMRGEGGFDGGGSRTPLRAGLHHPVH